MEFFVHELRGIRNCHGLIQLECWSVTLILLYLIQSFAFVFEFTSEEKRLHNIYCWE
jgi:hypothetical protein